MFKNIQLEKLGEARNTLPISHSRDKLGRHIYLSYPGNKFIEVTGGFFIGFKVKSYLLDPANYSKYILIESKRVGSEDECIKILTGDYTYYGKLHTHY